MNGTDKNIQNEKLLSLYSFRISLFDRTLSMSSRVSHTFAAFTLVLWNLNGSFDNGQCAYTTSHHLSIFHCIVCVCLFWSIFSHSFFYLLNERASFLANDQPLSDPIQCLFKQSTRSIDCHNKYDGIQSPLFLILTTKFLFRFVISFIFFIVVLLLFKILKTNSYLISESELAHVCMNKIYYTIKSKKTVVGKRLERWGWELWIFG